MGHLINPIAYRLGINKSWESTFYIKNIYYAEFIHNILNFRNFLYYLFFNKKALQSGIFLSEIIFFKNFKNYIVNIYIYYLELEKSSYKFMNNLYINYYKKDYLKGEKSHIPDFPPHYWFLHNADLYAFLYIFYNIFFSKTEIKNKKINKKYINLNFDSRMNINMTLLINKFNNIILKRIKGYDNASNIIHIYFNQLINKIDKVKTFQELVKFKYNMIYLKKVFKNNFRYDFEKEKIILSKLENIPKIRKIYNSLNKVSKLRLKKYFFFLFKVNHSFNNIDNNIEKPEYIQDINKVDKFLKKKRFSYNRNIFKLLKKYERIGTLWSRTPRLEKFEYDDLITSSDNIIDNFTLNTFLYFGKKVDFKKYKNYLHFVRKWGYLIKFLKYLETLEYKNWFKVSFFFLYLSVALHCSLQAKKMRVKFYVRDYLYKLIYVWLGKIYFLPFFKKLSNILLYFYITITSLKDVKFNFFFISVNDVSARFLANYIGLKLKKNHYLSRIINPVKKELWRLSKLFMVPKKNYKIKFRKLIFFTKKRLIKKIKIFFKYSNKVFFYYYKKNFTFFNFNLYQFKIFLIKNKLKKEEYIELYFFYNLFYGKLQNNFNIDFIKFNTKIMKKNLYYEYCHNINFIDYSNNQRFRMLNINHLLVSSNIIKHFMNFGYFKALWNTVNLFNKRNARKNRHLYKVSGLIAFKMAFKGRFSRKQRASSIWYAHGRASLNRLNVKMDYAFIKVPLINSIVSIKIWLFRHSVYKFYKFILNF